jgi:hypothetical protein
MQDASDEILKRKLLTRGFLHSLSPSWSRTPRTTGKSPYISQLLETKRIADLL